jgi:hypothetical protein
LFCRVVTVGQTHYVIGVTRGVIIRRFVLDQDIGGQWRKMMVMVADDSRNNRHWGAVGAEVEAAGSLAVII